jgi:predicted nucleotidyltransferase
MAVLAGGARQIHACACGCGRLIANRPRGRPRRFATPACKEAARRRRNAGLPEDFPRRTHSRGRRPFRKAPVTLPELRQHRARILRSAGESGVANVRIFGSVARGEATLASDVDFLVDIEPGRTVLAAGRFYMEMAELLEVPVDVVEAAALSGRRREVVLGEAVRL